MSDASEQAEAHAQLWKSQMQGDFNPGYTRTNMPSPEARLANASEYAAYQLGQINRNIARLVDILEKHEG
ncbi:MAG: hypothetical protein K5821_13460 [Nitrobacter sp.]|uniref:hypothetical protein n=1 Tax=Nitrobacter sp. TaxID=29420 RepID=UPI002633A536|nr:hypothetical protein [Nitrobacter sp.]MCV0387411.1 hypothetical protein [Nitrobacter sp.]